MADSKLVARKRTRALSLCSTGHPITPPKRTHLKMSNDLVVQLGAKLDQLASDMNQAGGAYLATALSGIGGTPIPALTMSMPQLLAGLVNAFPSWSPIGSNLSFNLRKGFSIRKNEAVAMINVTGGTISETRSGEK